MRKILILAAAVFAFCGCNDKEENQPFAGIDNHITSFALTAKDGTVYRAALVGDEIVVSIPRNVSLEGATADYELCEQAILYPDPARITDWDNEHRFRVMAYNQTLRDYAYSVKRNDVTAGSVALPTQADVEAFAATGATVIEGNLTIGDFSACDDPVTDLAPLAGLTDVRYNIVVGNSFAGEKLSGLENLRSAGGLVLGTATTPLTTAQDFDVVLPALESLGQLSVNGNTVAKLDLPKLVSTGTVYINAAKLSVFNVPALKECTGDLTILSGTNASTGNKALAALGLSSLEKSNGFAVAPVSQRIAVIGTPEDRLHRRQLHADLPDTAQSTQYAGTGASGRCIYLELPDGSDHIRNAESSFAGLVLALGQ